MAIAKSFDVVDYLIFGATMAISIAIGVFFALRSRKTTAEFLLGDRQMPVIPTALSLLASFQSGILILGVSSEMYMKGPVYFWYIFGIAVGIPLAAWLYLPVFYRLKLTSSYEYLELRFNSKALRYFGSINFMVSNLMYMAIVLYAPSTAMSAVTNFSENWLIVINGLVCTFYTTIGGLKAVVWTDAFQAIIMYAGLLSVIIQGIINVGGVAEVWNIADAGGRIFTDFTDANPFRYMNFWSVIWGTAFGWMTIYGTNQASIQRYVSVSSLKKARLSLLLVLPGILTMVPLVCLCGIVMYAYYAHCDPLKLKLISHRDQLLPYFTMDILGHIKGLPGLFVACLFSGTLSTISTGLNSLAAVTWEDFIKPRVRSDFSESRATAINKLLALIFGVISISLAFLPKHLGGVFEAALTVLAMLGGPLAGLFLFGILQPWADKYGAGAGVITSLTVMIWIALGAQIEKPYRNNLPQSIAGCSNESLFHAGFYRSLNETFLSLPNNSLLLSPTNLTVWGDQDIELSGVSYIYKLSYTLYGITALALVFAVGTLVSCFTGDKSLRDLDSRLICPGYYRLCCCLPYRLRKCLQRPEELPRF